MTDVLDRRPVQMGVAVGLLMNLFFGWWTWFLASA